MTPVSDRLLRTVREETQPTRPPTITLSARHETKSSAVLVELAEQQKLGEWKITPFGAENSGTVSLGAKSVPVCLQIGTRNGFHLRDTEGAGSSSCILDGELNVEVGEKLPETDMPRVAEQLTETITIFSHKLLREKRARPVSEKPIALAVNLKAE